MPNVSFGLPDDLRSRLKQMAAQRSLSFAAFVREALDEKVAVEEAKATPQIVEPAQRLS